MKLSKDSEFEPKPLVALLRRAEILPQLPSNFSDLVRSRLAQRQPHDHCLSSWLESFLSVLWQPRYVLAGMTLALMLGVLAGVFYGQTRQDHSALVRYFNVLDPVSPHP